MFSVTCYQQETDHLVYRGHGSAQHSVVDQSLPPAGCDTPLSCQNQMKKQKEEQALAVYFHIS